MFCALCVLVAACAPAAPATLQGTDLQKTPAPDFQLSDAHDQSFALSAQKGR
ncbi:MAG: SCO family protein, partial [Chloroflexi bacterium]